MPLRKKKYYKKYYRKKFYKKKSRKYRKKALFGKIKKMINSGREIKVHYFKDDLKWNTSLGPMDMYKYYNLP